MDEQVATLVHRNRALVARAAAQCAMSRATRQHSYDMWRTAAEVRRRAMTMRDGLRLLKLNSQSRFAGSEPHR